MAAAAGILNPQAAQPMAGRAAPMENAGSSGTSDAATNSATITANDFLTLLVTEMRNQDPTTATDPNQYINQLVQVNSLQQLIGINQTITAAFGPVETADTRSSATPAAKPQASATAGSVAIPAAGGAFQQSSPGSGNLSIPDGNPAAQRVAHALDGRTAAHRGLATPAIR